MKRFYLTLTAISCMVLLLCTSCGSKKNAVARYSPQDEIEEKLAEYKSNGWQIQGTSRTMRAMITMMIDKLSENPNLVEITGTANNFSVMSNGKEAASANASNRYAASATRLVQGSIESDSKLVQALGEERDKLYAAYSSSVEKLIRGELKEAYTLIRTRPDGKFDCEIHYLMDEATARSAREEALKAAEKEIESDQEFGNKIKDYVTQKPEIQ